MKIESLRHRAPRSLLVRVLWFLMLSPLVACEDPARPVPPAEGFFLSVDSEPRGGEISIDGEPTGERTPATFTSVPSGLRRVDIALDTVGLKYTYSAFAVVDTSTTASVNGRLTIRCTSRECVRDASQFHSAGNLRFAVNGAGPLFLYDGGDAGIIWPESTPNSYAAIGAGTVAGRVQGQGLALGLENIGNGINYWAGLPVPETVPGPPHRATVSAWILPTLDSPLTIRGLEIVHEVVVDDAMPDVLLVDVTYRNISADSAYLALDATAPPDGVTYDDAYLSFILDADIGPFAEASDDLISYSADRGLVFAYDSDFSVAGFTGGWASRPGIVGLMLIQGPGVAVRLNGWPRASDFLSGVGEAGGYALLTAQQVGLSDHPDPRIGHAPDASPAEYRISVANGPISLAPGEQATARFAVLLAAPVDGAFQSGVLQAAGDPADPERPMAAIAAGLFELADSLISTPPTSAAD